MKIDSRARESSDFLPIHLRSEHLLDGVARNGVEEQQQQDGQPEDDQALDDAPLVIVPDDVPDRFERIQEPHERSVRAASER